MKEELKKKRVVKQPKSKWLVWTALLGLFTMVSFGLYAVSGVSTYPTDKHRQVASEYADLSAKVWEQKDVAKALENPRLKELESSPEMAYSNIAGIGIGIVQFVIWVALVGFAFNYLRKNRIGKEQVRAIALIDATSTVLLMIPLLLLAPYFGYPKQTSLIPGVDPIASALITMPFVFLFSALITYIIARIFRWRYDRKYNFAVE